MLLILEVAQILVIPEQGLRKLNTPYILSLYLLQLELLVAIMVVQVLDNSSWVTVWHYITAIITSSTMIKVITAKLHLSKSQILLHNYASSSSYLALYATAPAMQTQKQAAKFTTAKAVIVQ